MHLPQCVGTALIYLVKYPFLTKWSICYKTHNHSQRYTTVNTMDIYGVNIRYLSPYIVQYTLYKFHSRRHFKDVWSVRGGIGSFSSLKYHVSFLLFSLWTWNNERFDSGWIVLYWIALERWWRTGPVFRHYYKTHSYYN